MKSESDAITDDEWLLRRVPRCRFRNDKTPFISPGAFEPRLAGRSHDPDLDGISLYREACLTNPDDCLLPVAADKRSEWGIVRISVAEIRELGMSAVSVHDDQVAGHVVIPELSASAFAKKTRSVQKADARVGCRRKW